MREDKMSLEPIHILLIEDDPADVLLLREQLADVGRDAYTLDQCCRLAEALHQLSSQRFDVILLDLSLPDSFGLETFTTLNIWANEIPIVVLTGLDDESLAVQAVRNGAQDYLIKGQVYGVGLLRALRYAIERHNAQAALRSLSLLDDLTGLYNRRGFFSLAGQHARLAHRQRKSFLLIYADLDHLKIINDTLGHDAGSQALIEISRIFTATFRESDILARLGGDEFVILVVDAEQDDATSIAVRLQDNLNRHNALPNRHYDLSLSIGITRFDPSSEYSLEDAIAQADRAMYQQKRSKQIARGA
jgi:diguanylate cyclase (GGDEF)-like protein